MVVDDLLENSYDKCKCSVLSGMPPFHAELGPSGSGREPVQSAQLPEAPEVRIGRARLTCSFGGLLVC